MMKEGLTFNYPVIRRFLQRVLCRAVLLLSEGKLLDIYKCNQFQLYRAPLLYFSTELLWLMDMNLLFAS
jgi:hypothetical protein